MSEEIRAGINGMNAAIAAKLAEVRALKQSVNVMLRQIGEEPEYPDVEGVGGDLSGPVRADQFYGKGLQTAVREYLERGKRAAGTEEIVKALELGGFDVEEQGWAKGHRPRILAIALVKNTATFRRLPNGMFGLETWYEPRTRKIKEAMAAESAKSKSRGKAARKKRQKSAAAESAAQQDEEGET